MPGVGRCARLPALGYGPHPATLRSGTPLPILGEGMVRHGPRGDGESRGWVGERRLRSVGRSGERLRRWIMAKQLSNAEVAATFHRLADLLAIRGENRFKVGAYR